MRYLSDDYILFTLPSASVLPYVTGRSEVTAALLDAGQTGSVPTSPLLVIAQPHAEGLPPLRFAEQEARAIAALYNAQPLIGDAATEAAFRGQAPGSRLIHIAAHGQLNARSPLFSRLILAPDAGPQAEDDGALEVHEVYGLDLTRADMVTLSACQTQLGSRSDGDDIVGLNRAFLYAGAPTVVASLWSVDDEATAVLMEAFYAHLKAGMGKAEALRAAQSDLRQDREHPQWAHPFYWAAFVLTGDPGDVSASAQASGIPNLDPGGGRGWLGGAPAGTGSGLVDAAEESISTTSGRGLNVTFSPALETLARSRREPRGAQHVQHHLAGKGHRLPRSRVTQTPVMPRRACQPKKMPITPGTRTSSASAGCPRRDWLTRSQLKRKIAKPKARRAVAARTPAQTVGFRIVS